MPHIYVMISQTGTSGSEFFKLITRKPYNHSSIAFDRELREMYSFGRRLLYFQFVAGLVRENPDTFVYKRFTKTICKIYEVPCTDAQYAKLRRMMDEEYLPEFQRYKYDFFGLPFRCLGIKYERKYRYVCSHFVAKVIQRAGIHIFSKDPFFIYPYHLEEITGAKCIYEGLLTGYRRGHFADSLPIVTDQAGDAVTA